MATTFNSPAELVKGTYAHTAAVTGGTTIHVSGQVAFDANGQVVGTTFAEQTEKTFENLKVALAGAGAAFNNIVKMNIYVRDLTASRVATFREVRTRFLGSHQPASTLVGTTALVHEELMLEVEVIAVID